MPDLNTVPASPHALAAARRSASNPMPPPPVPSSPSLNILPSNQSAVANGQIPSPLPSPLMNQMSSMPLPSSAEALSGPGPLRHPRPLTPADIHQQLEKEQEAVVNRLTRELSLLRAAQNASVVSNTSSASGTDPAHDPNLLSGTGFSIPSSAPRHHRTSSNASARSQAAAAALLSSSAEARRPISLSRQNSLSRRSQTSSPGPQHLHVSGERDSSVGTYFQQQRAPPGSLPSNISVAATPGSAGLPDQLSPGLLPATSRYEETAFYRSELDAAKRENETLRRRIRDLERLVRDRRTSDASRTRSESVSTTASATVPPIGGGTGIAGPREGRPTERDRGLTSVSVAGSVGIGVPDDEVQVGESAASAGLR